MKKCLLLLPIAAVSLLTFVAELRFAALWLHQHNDHADHLEEVQYPNLEEEEHTREANNYERRHLPFPRWDDKTGIPMAPLLEFIDGVLHQTTSAVHSIKVLQKPRPPNFFAETVYVVDAQGVHVSHTTRQRTWQAQLKGRGQTTERILALAWNMLLTAPSQESSTESNATSKDPWARLREAVLHQQGFPYVAWYGDYQECCQNNWRGHNHSIPLFTVAARLDCDLAFPTPTYMTIRTSQPIAADWDAVMAQWRAQYSNANHHRQIPKVVWRGGLTGDLANYSNPRWRLVTAAIQSSAGVFDVGFTDIPPRHNNLGFNLTAKVIREGLWASGRIVPMAAFQRYAAVLDQDGNSW